MTSRLKAITKAPLFPFVPLIPMLFGGGLVVLEAIMLSRVRRLAKRIDELIQTQRPLPA